MKCKKRRKGMRRLKIIGVVFISAVLLLSSVGTALADDEDTPTPEPTAEAEAEYQGLFGTVGEGSDGILKLVTKAHGELEVLLNDETIYKVPGQKEASKDNIAVGSRLAILAMEGEDERYIAVRVMVVPDKATRRHVTGTVVSVEDKTMTITNANGESLTIEIPEGVKGGVVGSFISAAVRQSDKEKPVLVGAQTAEQIRERIRTHLAEVAARKAEKETEKEQKGRDIEHFNTLLERLSERHQEVLNLTLGYVQNERARQAIQQSIGNVGGELARDREGIREARGDLENGQKPTDTPTPSRKGR